MGEEKFKEHFLLNESGIDPAKVARRCGIQEQEAREIFELLDELASHAEFYDGSGGAAEQSIKYSRIADIGKDGAGRFTISYYLPHLAKGRYAINYEKLRELKAHGIYSGEDAGQVDALVKQLEVINIRKAVIHRLLEEIIEFQSEYLRTGLEENLVPFSQKAAAKRLEIDPSMVNRAIYARSVTVPSGRELSLREFFPSKKDVVKSIISGLMAGSKKPLSDKELSRALLEKHGYRVSRHLAQIYRKELGIAAVKGKNA
jgi:RNA polymerase sigma-54 factor